MESDDIAFLNTQREKIPRAPLFETIDQVLQPQAVSEASHNHVHLDIVCIEWPAASWKYQTDFVNEYGE